MPAIYTNEWYESLKEILNGSDQVTKNAPRGVWHVLAEIKGDGVSPYLGQGEVKRFAIVLEDGRCTSYQELNDPPPRKDLDRKSTRLNSSHGTISNAVFSLNKKTH